MVFSNSVDQKVKLLVRGLLVALSGGGGGDPCAYQLILSLNSPFLTTDAPWIFQFFVSANKKINRVYNIIVQKYLQIVSTFSASVLSALSASSTVSALMSVHSNSNKSSKRCPSWKREIDKGFFLKSLINVGKITLANVFLGALERLLINAPYIAGNDIMRCVY